MFLPQIQNSSSHVMELSKNGWRYHGGTRVPTITHPLKKIKIGVPIPAIGIPPWPPPTSASVSWLSDGSRDSGQAERQNAGSCLGMGNP